MRRGAPLTRQARLKRHVRKTPIEARVALTLRSKGHCERCNGRGVLDPHHLLPRSRGGTDALENLALLCRRCHRAVHDHTAEDWRKWVR